MISFQDRLDYYIGNFNYNTDYPEPPTKVGHDIIFRSDQDYSGLKSTYLVDIDRYKSYTNKNFWLCCGDHAQRRHEFKFGVKTRDSTVNSKGVILNLNTPRHWMFVAPVFRVDDQWSNKNNTIIWRGSCTGIEYDDRNYTRLDFVKQYQEKYDVGFMEKHQGVEFYKQPISVDTQLKYKYLPVIDGNDKSSALNWVLASNSVPIMPKPRFHSWLCEPWLQPYVHYVPVEYDFSNLESQIEWCKEHDEECKQIARNGRAFLIDNFTDRDLAIKIEKALIDYLTE